MKKGKSGIIFWCGKGAFSFIAAMAIAVVINCGGGGGGGGVLPPGGGGGGTPTTNYYTIIDSGQVGEYFSMAVAGGNIYLSYFDHNTYDLKFAKSSNFGDTWTATTIDATGSVGKFTSIAATGKDIYISYMDETNTSTLKIAISHDSGDTWSCKIIDSSSSGYFTGNASSIAVVGDNVYISHSYQAPGGSLRFTKSTDKGVTWKTTSPGVTTYGYYSSIAVDGSNIYILTRDRVGVLPNYTYEIKLSKSSNSGATWDFLGSVVDSNKDIDFAWYRSGLAVQSNNVYVSYTDSVDYLKLASSANYGKDWTTTNIDSGYTSALFSSVYVNSNKIYVVTNNDLYRSFDTGSKWERKDIQVAGAPFMISDGTNMYVASYYNQGNCDLRFSFSDDMGDTWLSY